MYYKLISLWDSSANKAKTNAVIYKEIADFINANSDLTVKNLENALTVNSEKQGIVNGMRQYINGTQSGSGFGRGGIMANYLDKTACATVAIGEDKKSFCLGFSKNGGINIDVFYSKGINILTNEEKGVWVSLDSGILFSLIDDDSTTSNSSFNTGSGSTVPRTSNAITLAKLFSPNENVLFDGLYMDLFAPLVNNTILVELDGKAYIKEYTNNQSHTIWMPLLEITDYIPKEV